MRHGQTQTTITDPAALAELEKCRSVRELADRLNQAGVACTLDEALHFLRTWQKLEDEREALAPDEPGAIQKGAGGLAGLIARIRMGAAMRCGSEPLTIADVLERIRMTSP